MPQLERSYDTATLPFSVMAWHYDRRLLGGDLLLEIPHGTVTMSRFERATFGRHDDADGKAFPAPQTVRTGSPGPS